MRLSPSFSTASSRSVRRFRSALLLVVAALLLVIPQAQAQDDSADAPASEQQAAPEELKSVGLQGGKFGVGTASAWPAYGISGTYHVNEKITAQAILGFLGSVNSFSARGWYRFNRSAEYDMYFYGSAGLYQRDYVFLETETTLGIGAGIGADVSIGRLFDLEDFPPIFANSEVGIAYADFAFYDLSFITFGFGIHYRFGNQ